MRARVLLAVLGMLVAATPARAANTHSISATCATVWAVVGPVAVVGHAESGGSVRAVSTEIACTVEPQYCCSPVTFQQQVPGPVAVVAGHAHAPIFQPRVCVDAWAYWADGFSFRTLTGCAYGSITVQATR